MKTLWGLYNLLVAAAVTVLVAHHYYNNGAGLPLLSGLNLHQNVYYAVAAAAALGPVFWLVSHLFGGIFFGMAAGGFWDGIKLSLMIGAGLALATCWPLALAAGLGVYIGGGPLLYVMGAVVLACVLFGLKKAIDYLWHSAQGG